MRKYFVYIMASNNNSTIYIGVTNNIQRRVTEHKTGAVEGFTKRYNIHKLVYCEIYNDVNLAISREKQLKKWNRNKKNILIERMNPNWEELNIAL